MKMAKVSVVIACLLFLFLIACPSPDQPGDNVPTTTPVVSNTTQTPTPTPTPVPAPGEAHAAEALSVAYQNANSGIRATVLITRAVDESDVSFYNLYFASSEPDIIGDAFAHLAATGADLTYNIPFSLELNPGIQRIYVYSENADGKESPGQAHTDFIPNVELRMIDDFNSGSGSSAPGEMCIFDDRLFFSAFTADQGRELAYSDGLSMARVANSQLNIASGGSNPDGNPQDFAVLNGTGGSQTLFFRATNGDDEARLYSLDQSNGLTVIDSYTDINSDTLPLTDPRDIVAMNGAGTGSADNLLYFVAYNGSKDDVFAITTDGTVYSLSELDNTDAEFINPGYLVINDPGTGLPGSDLYFVANAPAAPTATNIYNRGEGALQVGQFTPPIITSISQLVAMDNMLYFQVYMPIRAHVGYELGQYDPTDSTVYFGSIVDYNASYNGASSYPGDFYPHNGMLILSADVQDFNRGSGAISTGVEPVIYLPDGMPDNSDHHLIDTVPGSNGSEPGYFAATGDPATSDLLFYRATDETGDRELWVCDTSNLDYPTPWKINLNLIGGSNPQHMTVYNGKLYFAADTGNGAGSELYSLELKY